MGREALGHSHGLKYRETGPRIIRKARASVAKKLQGDRLAGITSACSSAAMSLAQKAWVAPRRAWGFRFNDQKA